MSAPRWLAWPLLCAVTAAPLAGCWDRLEIEDRATVVAVGLDPTGLRGLHLSAQIAIPGQIPLGPGGGAIGGDGITSPRQTVFVDASDGPTVDQALASLQHTLNNELFLGHVRIVFVNETLARRGLHDVIDFFHRSAAIRRTSWLVVTPGRAADATDASPAFSSVPGLFFTDMMEHYVNMGVLPPIFLGTFLVTSADQGQDAILPYLWVQGQGTRLLGAAVFRGERMVDTLSTEALQAVEDVIGPRKGGQVLMVPVAGAPGSRARLRVIDRQAHLRPGLAGGAPRVWVDVRLEANVEEEVGVQRLERPLEMEAVGQAAGTMVRDDILRAIRRTQADGADVFGLGELFRARYPGFFRREVRTKQAWETLWYPRLVPEVQVRVLVRRVGMENR